MGTKTITIKRPNESTPERALELWKKGIKVGEMAKMWGITGPYIYYLLHGRGGQGRPPGMEGMLSGLGAKDAPDAVGQALDTGNSLRHHQQGVDP